MYLTKWSFNTVIAAAIVSYGQGLGFADECVPRKWGLPFGSRTIKASPACAAPAPTLAAAPAESPEQPVAAPLQPAVAAPAMFAAPPAAGEITGATNSIGIRGLSLTMPEMRLQLPTVHLPSLVRSSRNAEMHVDGGRAPLVTGAPAAYGQIANAGQVVGTQFQAAPAAAPARTRPAAAPASAPAAAAAPIDSCVQGVGAYNSQLDTNIQDAEVVEMRRALMSYRQELDRMRRTLDTASQNGDGVGLDGDVPPAPAPQIRRLSYPQQREGANPAKRRVASEKIVEASYREQSDDEGDFQVEEPVERHPRRVTRPAQAPAASAPRPSGPAKRGGTAPREIEQLVPANVGFSYIPDADEAAPADDGLGVWKGDGTRPTAKRTDGAAKRSSR